MHFAYDNKVVVVHMYEFLNLRARIYFGLLNMQTRLQ